MTDYLEEHLGNAEALLERVRKLEQGVSGLTPKSDKQKNVDNFRGITKNKQEIPEKSKIISETEKEVYKQKRKVIQPEEMVDVLDIDLKTHENGQNRVVNRHFIEDDSGRSPDQSGSVAEETAQYTQLHAQWETQAGTKRKTQPGMERAAQLSAAWETQAGVKRETQPGVKCETQSDVEQATQAGAKQTDNRSPISDRLEELDRAVFALPALLPEQRGTTRGSWGADRRTGSWPDSLSSPRGLTVDPNITGVPGGSWSGLGATAPADPAYGGAQSWAEQADRMFRRDSRRYDGGFYLY